MKTRIFTQLATVLLVSLYISTANAQQLGIYEFSTGTDCATLDMDVTAQPATATFTSITKSASVSCESSTAEYITNSWTDAASPDLVNHFLPFTITADPTYYLNLTQISFDIHRSVDGPTAGHVYSNVNDGGDVQQGSEFTIGTTSSTIIIPLTLASPNGGNIGFKLAFFNAANATASSKITIDNIEVLGTGPLPIELVSFTAVVNENNYVTLQWETASESNNDYFSVERSSNGIDFEEIMTISGAGNSSTPLFYNALDNNPEEGISYYRLKQTDYDGRHEYFQIVSVEINRTTFPTVNIYPNPTTGAVINVQANNVDDEEILIVLSNVMGQTVYSKIALQNNGNVITALTPSDTLTPGIYIVSGVSKFHKELFKEKLVIKKF